MADWCPDCRRPQVFTVTNHFRVEHIYYISLGRGTLASTVRQCWQCGAQYECEADDYEEFLPEKVVEKMSFGELLQETNHALMKDLESQRQKALDLPDVLPGDDD